MKRFKSRFGQITLSDSQGVITDFQGKETLLEGAVTTALAGGVVDADGAFFFQRQLESIKARSYDVKYPELKARQLFPVSNEAGPGVTTITYRTYDQAGIAKIINAYADDLPRADISGKETSIPVVSLGISYGYNIDEIQASQLIGASLDQKKANAAVRAIEKSINRIAFFGSAKDGLPGLFTDPNVPTGPVLNNGNGTQWINKNPDEIVYDVNSLFGDIFDTTNMCEAANTLLLPPSHYSYIASTPRSPTSDTTIAQYIVQNSIYINSLADIIPVNECSGMHNPELKKDCIIAYDRNPDKLSLEIPVELEMMPVQQKSLAFVVPARARVAGLNIYYPLSMSIGTGI